MFRIMVSCCALKMRPRDAAVGKSGDVDTGRELIEALLDTEESYHTKLSAIFPMFYRKIAKSKPSRIFRTSEKPSVSTPPAPSI